MNLVFLDVETTGTEEHDRLFQVAFLVRGDENDSHDGFFKPPVPISIEASSITHVTTKMVETAMPFQGSFAHSALQGLFEKGAVLIAHNAQFDAMFLAREGIFPKQYICTMKLAHHLDTESKLTKHNLQYLRYFHELEVPPVQAHDAMGDVIVLEKLFDLYSEKMTVEEMLEVSARPIMLKKMGFGKYRDKTFSWIHKNDYNYLQWMLREMREMDENLRYTVNHYVLLKP